MKISCSIILVFSVVFLFSCKKEKKADYTDIIEVLDNTQDAVFDSLTVPEHLRSIVKQISEINTYETGVLAKGQEKSENSENFKKLTEIASDDELRSLLNNKNKTVAVYAAVGLLNRKPELLEEIFQKILHLKSKVHTQNGCIFGDQNPAEPLYDVYCRSLNFKEVRTDLKLRKLDSLIIFNSNSPESLLQEAFRYRVYPKSYRKRIEDLAFKNHKIDAVRYLNHWHKGDYADGIQKEFISMLKNDSLSYNKKMILSALLSFRNSENRELVLDYIKKDTLFIDDHEIAKELESNGIFPGEYPTK
ncbi:hypothetical protein ACN9MN_06720 [Chryseobacterium sp. S-02]|uniref:hypothetical protein n=1 Tax=Chryseobacterium sp. S-02 TaxID=3404064 RepID=UPI003CF45870